MTNQLLEEMDLFKGDEELDKEQARRVFWEICADLVRLGWSVTFKADKTSVTVGARRGLKEVLSTQAKLIDCVYDIQEQLLQLIIPQGGTP